MRSTLVTHAPPLVALACAFALLPASARAQGFPSFDAVAERVIVGRAPVTNAQPLAGDARVITRGSFADDGTALRMIEPAAFGETTWVATAATMGSGLVRARFVVGKKLDASILVHTKLIEGTGEDSGELDAALAISVERNQTLKLLRFEGRSARPLGSEVKLAVPLAVGTQVELVVVVAGPVVMADLYDGASLKLLAHVAAHDSGTQIGAIGVRVHKLQDFASGLVFLTYTPTEGPTGMRADDGAGDGRVLGFAPDMRAQIPKELRVIEERDGYAVVVTDPTGLERVRRAGLTPFVRARVPFRYADTSRPSLMRPRAPPTRTDGGFRVDEGYKDAEDVDALVHAYAQRFPKIAREVSIGKSVLGRDIWALVIGKNADAPAVLLDGAHHGGELMSTEAVLDAMQQLTERYGRDADVTRWVNGLVIWCVPLVNPDGTQRFVYEDRDYDRRNAVEVDLYRNYPVNWGALGEVGSRSYVGASKYRGPAPLSEPESRALFELAERERFAASIDFHTNATTILVPYTDPSMLNPEPNEAWSIAETIAAALPTQTNHKRFIVARNLYPVDGTAQDAFRQRFGTVALLVEMPTHNPLPYERGRPAAIAGTRPTWQLLLSRVLDGPTISGRVRDASGAPIAAEVRVVGVTLRAGERWTARPRDGRFTRLLAAGGRTTIAVKADGYREQQKSTDVAGHSNIEFVMEPE